MVDTTLCRVCGRPVKWVQVSTCATSTNVDHAASDFKVTVRS